MNGAEDRRRYAGVFDHVARGYARHRPTYPDELIDRACAGLGAGAPVLEVGCGTGQLTAALLARGLRVHAIDPAPNMIEVARETVGDAAEFQLGRFEDVELPPAPFAGVFSATAFHWVDPEVGWAKAARALRPGGRLGLLQYVGVRTDDTAAADDALMGALGRAAPELAASWPRAQDVAGFLAGFEQRRDNISAVWTFIGHNDVTAPDAAALFTDVRLDYVPVAREQTADELNALLRTTSMHFRLGPEGSEALARENRRAIEGLGGVARTVQLAVLVTARAVG